MVSIYESLDELYGALSIAFERIVDCGVCFVIIFFQNMPEFIIQLYVMAMHPARSMYVSATPEWLYIDNTIIIW
jgi:hypothetical protein